MLFHISAEDVSALESLPFEPKPTSLTEGQVERTYVVWTGGPGRLDVGLWECTPGRFIARRDGYTEICYFLSGHVTIEDDDGSRRTYRAGDLLVQPEGWSGIWEVHEQVRKIFILGRAG